MAQENESPRIPMDKFSAEEGTYSMTGVEALVRVPLDVRRDDMRHARSTAAYISGYEGSPLGGYDIALLGQGSELDRLDIVFHPGVNEELAATAVQGTQLAATFDDARVDGVTGFWYGKSPGLDRASDALRHANLSGAHHLGGAVAFIGDDPSAKSSTVPGASEPLLADLGIPTLYPANPQEVLDFGVHAAHMSRVSGLWTALKVVTNVADGSGMVDVDPHRRTIVRPDDTIDGSPYRHEVHARMLQPHLTGLERSRNDERLELARRYARANGLDTISGADEGARVGIVAAGKTYVDLSHALARLGLDAPELSQRGVRLLRLGMVYPLEPSILREFADGLTEIIVVEEKRAFLELAVKDALYGTASSPRVVGKRTGAGATLFPSEGELDPDVIAEALARQLLGHGTFPTVAEWKQRREIVRSRRQLTLTPIGSAASRTPYFCSGCPHSRSAKVPEGSMVGGGIGCHALVLVMPETQVGDVAGLTQMGGEGAQWNGMYPFLARDHLIQNIGDGTFHHSGSLAVRAAIAGGAHITYKLLYNSAVAMTGGQTVTGGMTVPQITRALAAEGVTRTIITTREPRAYSRRGLARGVEVWSQDRVLEAQEVLASSPGVTLLIHDQECATELRRKRKRGLAPDPEERVVINERVCEGCGDCGRVSNCLSVRPVSTEFGRKTQIDQSSCNKDYSCLDGDCPSFMTVTPRKKSSRSRRRAVQEVDASRLSEPVLPSAAQGYTIRVLGIGGSGVVTLSRILSFAAVADARFTRSLDQTGLAQKGGAVISDIKISDSDLELANKATAGEVDLYLGSDLLVAANPANLLTADRSRTFAVVSTAQIPTGQMVVDPTIEFPAVADLVDAIRASTQKDTGVFLDARAYSEWLFGDDQFANLLLLGAAYQSGRVPIRGEHIEAAIRANGVKAEANIAAFRRGRQFIQQPDRFERDVAKLRPHAPRPADLSPRERSLVDLVGASPGSRLAEIVRIRVPELVAFQNLAYARRYVEVVERVRSTERHLATEELTETVAEQLFNLMAYKDEYEVARLLLSDEGAAEARRQFGEDAKIAYRLHPPILRAMGMKKKISLGEWARPLFQLLVVGRHVRGTVFDIFGYANVRRTERRLIEQYIDEIDRLTEGLGAESHAHAVAVAALPDMVRGYEEIKMRNVAAYREELARLRDVALSPVG